MVRYIRAIGFLYIRFCVDPHEVFEWFWDYIDEDTPIRVRIGETSLACSTWPKLSVIVITHH